MNFSGVDEVEYLHHDKGVKDKSEVTWVHVEVLVDGIEVLITVEVVESTWSDCASYNSIVPFVLGMI